MTASEFSSGTGLEVRLRRQRLLWIAEGHAGLDAPGAIFCSVWAGAAVVVAQALFQVIRDACVVAGWIVLADENADVLVFGWHAKP